MGVILQVAVGGALGAVLRYLSVQAAMRGFGSGAYVGTFAVNFVGSVLMGLCAAWLLERAGSDRFAPFVMTGVLGGFTTFSAFSLDAFALWEQGRQGMAMAYVCGSVVLAIGGLILGMTIMRAVVS